MLEQIQHARVPQARIVRKAGHLVAPPRAPRDDDGEPSAVRTFVVYAIGLWPLTGVVMLLLGLLFMAARNGSP